LLVLAPSCAAEALSTTISCARTRLVRVVDGDTIKVDIDGREESCRLLGIDAPELSYGRLTAGPDRLAEHTPEPDRAELGAAIAVVRRHAEIAEERARAARAALTGIVGDRAVTLVPDGTQPARDRYGRLLVYVEIDGMDVNAELVRLGHAIIDDRFECDRLGAYLKVRAKEEATGNGDTD
jgi:micrococcal nuclease